MSERNPDRALDLSLVIACYNEECVIETSVQRILEILDHTTYSYELIFIDDCSRDRTRELILDIVKNNPQRSLRYVFHEKNLGRGGTVTEGLRLARGMIAGYLDIDLEVDALYILACMLAISHGADVATGRRIYRFYWAGLVRWILSNGYSSLQRLLLQVPLQDTETGYKFFSREEILPVLDQVQDTRWFWDTEILVRSYLRGYRIVEIPCLFQRRFDKHSTVNLVRDTLEYFQKLWQFRGIVRQIRQSTSADPERQKIHQ